MKTNPAPAAWPFPTSKTASVAPAPTPAPESKKQYPVRGTTYSLRYILETLYLRDSPHLEFVHEGIPLPIQDSHCTQEEFLANADFADTNWTYQYETSEWIPVFKLARGEDLNGLVTVVPERDYDTGEIVEGLFMAFPTHAPRLSDYEQRMKNDAAKTEDVPDEESFADALNAMDKGHAAMQEENAKLREQK